MSAKGGKIRKGKGKRENQQQPSSSLITSIINPAQRLPLPFPVFLLILHHLIPSIIIFILFYLHHRNSLHLSPPLSTIASPESPHGPRLAILLTAKRGTPTPPFRPYCIKIDTYTTCWYQKYNNLFNTASFAGRPGGAVQQAAAIRIAKIGRLCSDRDHHSKVRPAKNTSSPFVHFVNPLTSQNHQVLSPPLS